MVYCVIRIIALCTRSLLNGVLAIETDNILYQHELATGVYVYMYVSVYYRKLRRINCYYSYIASI